MVPWQMEKLPGQFLHCKLSQTMEMHENEPQKSWQEKGLLLAYRGTLFKSLQFIPGQGLEKGLKRGWIEEASFGEIVGTRSKLLLVDGEYPVQCPLTNVQCWQGYSQKYLDVTSLDSAQRLAGCKAANDTIEQEMPLECSQALQAAGKSRRLQSHQDNHSQACKQDAAVLWNRFLTMIIRLIRVMIHKNSKGHDDGSYFNHEKNHA